MLSLGLQQLNVLNLLNNLLGLLGLLGWPPSRKRRPARRSRQLRGIALLCAPLLASRCALPPATCEGRTFVYDGFEDARALWHGGRLHLVASHEDCRGRRRVCLLRLRQEEDGALIQEAAWPLTLGAAVEEGGAKGQGRRGDSTPNSTPNSTPTESDPTESHPPEGVGPPPPEGGGPPPAERDPPLPVLQEVEKNWSPFVHGGELYFSYSLEPHVVLRCGWVGGRCALAHNSSSELMRGYGALGQSLRGGTPYVRLSTGGLLAAMHVADRTHEPPLYATIFYLLEGEPPFRVTHLSPKVRNTRTHTHTRVALTRHPSSLTPTPS